MKEEFWDLCTTLSSFVQDIHRKHERTHNQFHLTTLEQQSSEVLHWKYFKIWGSLAPFLTRSQKLRFGSINAIHCACSVVFENPFRRTDALYMHLSSKVPAAMQTLQLEFSLGRTSLRVSSLNQLDGGSHFVFCVSLLPLPLSSRD